MDVSGALFSTLCCKCGMRRVQGLEGGGHQYGMVLDCERRLSGGRRCSDRLPGGWKVCNESGEILRCLRECEHVMCLTWTLHSMTTLAWWAAAERSRCGVIRMMSLAWPCRSASASLRPEADHSIPSLYSPKHFYTNHRYYYFRQICRRYHLVGRTSNCASFITLLASSSTPKPFPDDSTSLLQHIFNDLD